MKICDNGTIREMTASEKQEQEKVYAEAETRTEAQAAKAVARQAVLDKLGLTADEAAALLG
jgi:hypothetical protein